MVERGSTPNEPNGEGFLDPSEDAIPGIDSLEAPVQTPGSEGPSSELKNTFREEGPKTTDEEEEENDPQFECGVLVCLLPGGEGVRFQALTGPEYARETTLTDLNMMANHLSDHTQAVMTGTQVLNLLQQSGMGKKVRLTKGIRR